MPRNTREWSKRKLDEAVRNIEWAQYHLSQIHEKYKDHHKDIAEVLSMSFQQLNFIMLNLKELKKMY